MQCKVVVVFAFSASSFFLLLLFSHSVVCECLCACMFQIARIIDWPTTTTFSAMWTEDIMKSGKKGKHHQFLKRRSLCLQDRQSLVPWVASPTTTTTAAAEAAVAFLWLKAKYYLLWFAEKKSKARQLEKEGEKERKRKKNCLSRQKCSKSVCTWKAQYSWLWCFSSVFTRIERKRNTKGKAADQWVNEWVSKWMSEQYSKEWNI